MTKEEKYKQDLREALMFIAKYTFQNEKYYSSMGKVVSVDDNEKTCEVSIFDGETIEDVRLQQVSSSEGLLIKPKIDSVVIVGWTSNTTAHIEMYSEIEEIIFQDGTNDGMIKINDLTSKLNGLVDEVNSLKNSYNAHIHTTTATVGATAVPGVISPTTSQASPASSFNKSDYENEKFKH